ncbi:hypothetical protein CMQ_6291 [Grosmannia clavigera kw1407]|uniref:Uncharacterized protein n=1 Tax=Grosmannia clavigera (strain kw1407 / UAMH 11150) TaxID=655863 RepID=F0XLE0_GROCL|nr:uncharacterized protein CMQ_6291 [Grosmannia clavigera kw1407]EFX01349.1 hypothetical protein CMQ_6291 [Grosmannia clavigera kw1407]
MSPRGASISGQAAIAVSRAKLAAATTRDYAAEARRHEERMLDVAATTKRDAVMVKAVRITDFFDCAANAWAAMGNVTQLTQDTIKKADELVEAARVASDADKPDANPDGSDDGQDSYQEELAERLKEFADRTMREACAVQEQLHVAQGAVHISKKAIEQDTAAREAVESNAKTAMEATKLLSERIKTVLRGAELEVANGVARVTLFSEQAVTAAIKGETTRAKDLVESSKTEATSIESQLDRVIATRDLGLDGILAFLGGSL